ncbi:nucleotidyltransferase domain-containing protein [Azospirillum sp. SYSU D00513]|uniref:nucleotidyltransferase domain-containing protein n=1 Tax=Azospirillum sp. SYSU D00513 TaxID=2812561 RepID=UPI001A95A128|nr:nucleotidyltransferase domain-containing protein [Azospirillum sp. SYSU D00513]
MRLTAEEIAAIKTTAAEIFGPAAAVRLFGSRVDDDARGGDIDLYLEVDAGLAGWTRESAFRLLLEDRIGEQRIDVVLQERGQPLPPIAEIARDTGVPL